MTTDRIEPNDDPVASLLRELRQTAPSRDRRVDSVIVDVDVDLDALLATLPEPPPAAPA